MKTNQQKLKENIPKFYLFEVLYSLMFYTPIIVLFFQKNGLSLTEVMVIQFINSVLWILMEIPAGYFADVMGRKISMMMTGIFATLSMLTFGLGTNFYHFLIGSLLWALTGVFLSGADSAFIYDTLKDLNREGEYKKIWGKTFFYANIGMATAGIIGGFLAGMNFRYPFFVVLPIYIFLIPLALSFHEPKKHRTVSVLTHVSELFKAIKTTIFQNKKLKWLLLYSGLMMSVISIAYYLYQPYLKLSGLDLVYFGFVFAAFNVIEAFSAKYAHRIEKKVGPNFSLIFLFILIGLCYLLMGNIIFIFSFVFAFILQFVRGFSSIVISDYIHKVTDSKIRATVLSVESFTKRGFCAILVPIIGWLLGIYSLPQTLTMIGIMTLVVGGVFAVMLWKNRVVEKDTV